jgi:hypothetical protein
LSEIEIFFLEFFVDTSISYNLVSKLKIWYPISKNKTCFVEILAVSGCAYHSSDFQNKQCGPLENIPTVCHFWNFVIVYFLSMSLSQSRQILRPMLLFHFIYITISRNVLPVGKYPNSASLSVLQVYDLVAPWSQN